MGPLTFLALATVAQRIYNRFILQDFYHAILELFEDEEDEWVVETLAWWNRYVSSLPFNLHDNIVRRQVFPDKPGTKNK